MTKWSVVSTVRTSRSQLDLFVSHYLLMGAHEVYLYFDDPNLAYEYAEENVICRICDDDWWRGARPEALEVRQRRNASDALTRTTAKWLMHCDSDEFLSASRFTVTDILAALPPSVGGLMVRSGEAVYRSPPTSDQIFSTPFFKTYFDSSGRPGEFETIARSVYGQYYRLTKGGLFGHTQGKSFVRTDSGVKHMPLHHVNNVALPLEMRHTTTELLLRHYDSSSFETWQQKHLRRISGEVIVSVAGKWRARQEEAIKHAYSNGGEDGLRAIHKIFSSLPDQDIVDGILSGFIRVITPEAHLISCDDNPTNS